MNDVLFLAGGAILGLELWRRYLVKTRALPGWTTIVSWACFAIAAAGAITARIMLEHAFDAAVAEASGEKASQLAKNISYAMNANAVGVAAIALATIVLGVMTISLRRK